MKITPSTPLPGASMVATALWSSRVYSTGWCRALGVVGPYSSQLQVATMSWAWVWWMRLGRTCGQSGRRRQPEPVDGPGVDRGLARGLERGGDAVRGVVHDRVTQEHDAQRSGRRRRRLPAGSASGLGSRPAPGTGCAELERREVRGADHAGGIRDGGNGGDDDDRGRHDAGERRAPQPDPAPDMGQADRVARPGSSSPWQTSERHRDPERGRAARSTGPVRVPVR